MNLDFRKLSEDDQTKVIVNVIKQSGIELLEELLSFKEEGFDVYCWFNLKESNEGPEYWINIKQNLS
jgi:hypothetical protein